MCFNTMITNILDKNYYLTMNQTTWNVRNCSLSNDGHYLHVTLEVFYFWENRYFNLICSDTFFLDQQFQKICNYLSNLKLSADSLSHVEWKCYLICICKISRSWLPFLQMYVKCLQRFWYFVLTAWEHKILQHQNILWI